MKIIDNVFRDYKFEELGEGETFKIGEQYFMKTEDYTSNGDDVNAVNLANGQLVYMMYDQIVHPFQCELNVL